MNNSGFVGVNPTTRKGHAAFVAPNFLMADNGTASGAIPAEAAEPNGLSPLQIFIQERPIVVPVSFTEECLAAVKLAIEMTGTAERVHLIHVVTEREPHEDKYISDWNDDGCRIDRARQRLESACKSAGLNICSESLGIAFGQTAECVVEHATQHNAGLIVIPSHAKHTLLSLVRRSIAEQIVERAKCPVLVLKGL
ncbi:MAG: universal stress protein [Pirellulaceae bacterium]